VTSFPSRHRALARQVERDYSFVESTMKLRVEHTTRYQYDAPVSYALQQLKLTPKDRPGQQRVLDWAIDVEGGAQQLHYTDHHGNGVDLIAVHGGTSELVIRCHGADRT
jgi:transglutaminase-like putative cysteine protease